MYLIWFPTCLPSSPSSEQLMGENQLTEFRQPVLGAVHKVRQHSLMGWRAGEGLENYWHWMTWGGRGLKNCDISSSVSENSAFFLVLESFSKYLQESIMMTDFEKIITKAMISTCLKSVSIAYINWKMLVYFLVRSYWNAAVSEIGERVPKISEKVLTYFMSDLLEHSRMGVSIHWRLIFPRSSWSKFKVKK